MKTNDQNSNGDIPVTAADVDHYNTRGVVLLRNTLASDWINLIRHGIKQDLAKPGPLSREWGRGECHDRFFYDTVCWPRIREFREFIFNSPAAAMAAQLMGSREVRIVNDALFYRSAGTQTPSPFHQDVPYLPVEGRQICSIWIPLLPVEKSSSLQFVKGSHNWNKVFKRPNFNEPDLDDVHANDYEALVDYTKNPASKELISWEMEPGDCVFFHGMTIHGGSGNLAPNRGLEAFTVNWAGDDVKVKIRPQGMDPDLTSICAIYGLCDGDPIGSDGFPVVWPAPTG